MSDPERVDPVDDPAAAALVLALQVIGLSAKAADIVHRSGKTRLDQDALIRYARTQPVKVRFIASRPDRLAGTPMPALAPMNNGRWLVLGKVGDGKVLLQIGIPGHATPYMSGEPFNRCTHTALSP